MVSEEVAIVVAGSERVWSVAIEDVWTTPEVAQFLDISRQAINRRVKTRKLLGYSGGSTTLFPAWQFDDEGGDARPEVAELLEVLPADVDMAVVAQWAVTELDDSGRTPAGLLIHSETKGEALALAEAFGSMPPEDRPSVVGRRDVKLTGKDIEGGTPPPDEMTQAQRAILWAAADLFAAKGPGKVSLREVAAAAGVSYGLIHRFYRTKENLLVAVMEVLVSWHGDRLAGERDFYAAIDNSFGADVDAGRFGRMLMWSMLDGIHSDRLIGTARSHGYRTQIEALWAKPSPPDVRDEFDPNVVASMVALVGSSWDLFEPYLTALAPSGRERDDVRREATELLKVLVYATRPGR